MITKVNTMPVKIIKALLIASWLLTNSTVQAVEPQQSVSVEQKVHSDLIIIALKADFFNHTCRGISVNKNFNQVNRLFISKYSLTANNFIKQFINTNVSAEKQKQQTQFKRALAQIGGCTKARQNNWRNKINTEFRALFRQAERSSWYPL
jgi:hypothetical protein